MKKNYLLGCVLATAFATAYAVPPATIEVDAQALVPSKTSAIKCQQSIEVAFGSYSPATTKSATAENPTTKECISTESVKGNITPSELESLPELTFVLQNKVTGIPYYQYVTKDKYANILAAINKHQHAQITFTYPYRTGVDDCSDATKGNVSEIVYTGAGEEIQICYSGYDA